MDSDGLTWTSQPICARRSPRETALCGAPAYSTLFTNERRYVSCPGCLAEIGRRVADPIRRGPVAARALDKVPP